MRAHTHTHHALRLGREDRWGHSKQRLHPAEGDAIGPHDHLRGMRGSAGMS